MGIFLLLLGLDALYVAMGTRHRFNVVSAELQRGREAVETGDLVTAAEAFDEASTATDEINALMAHPSYVLTGALPLVGRDADALSALNRAARSASEAGLIAVDAGRALGGTKPDELAAAFYSNGRVQLETIEAGESYLLDARDALLEARGHVDGIGNTTFSSVGSAVESAHADITAAVEVTNRGNTLMSALPPLFGSDGPRKYFLAFQSPSQARGTGGIIGLYGVLEANEGRVAITHVGPYIELLTSLDTSGIRDLAGAQEFQRNYERAIKDAAEVNLSADFPAVAKRLLAVYEASTGESLDGVLATDPVALAELIKATGPIRGAGFDAPLQSDNAAEVLLHDTYIQFADDPQGQNRFLVSLIRNFYGAFDKSVDGPALVSALGTTTASRHLMLYSTIEEEQVELGKLGVGGDIRTFGPDVQHVYHNNLGDNKVDYYLDRSISTAVRFSRSGDASVRTTITLENHAPVSGDTAMTESYSDSAPPGMNVMDLRMLVPENAGSVRWSSEGRPLDASSGSEAGLPASWLTIEIPAGSTRVLVAEYDIRDAAQLLRGGDFSITLVPQAMTEPDGYVLKIVPPAGFEVRTRSPEEVQADNGRSALFRGSLTKPAVVDVELAPVGTG